MNIHSDERNILQIHFLVALGNQLDKNIHISRNNEELPLANGGKDFILFTEGIERVNRASCGF